ncbi:hypothetical protein BU23DRAFT_201961 [Bimuria novae-zelandiae CBS 107.79]|uniref:Uncharacterized protein n=1 Tax=Bimuria novae-zelandiae CBS 107.79 TaxID=1447943 RepID=A0A6A5V0W5_9PLEO|nr:hypothetical protein BU23DRAFT_201961 [Bimuria novae-zelandiae CBS 107.79]
MVRNSARGAIEDPIRAMGKALMPPNTMMVRHTRIAADCAASVDTSGAIHFANSSRPVPWWVQVGNDHSIRRRCWRILLFDDVLDDRRGVIEFAILNHPSSGARNSITTTDSGSAYILRPRPLFHRWAVISPPLQIPAANRGRAGIARLSFVYRFSLSQHPWSPICGPTQQLPCPQSIPRSDVALLSAAVSLSTQLHLLPDKAFCCVNVVPRLLFQKLLCLVHEVKRGLNPTQPVPGLTRFGSQISR